MQKYRVNLNNATTIIFKLLYKTIIKLIEYKTTMQEININSNQTTQRITNININKLINIVSKKQNFIKKKVTLKIIFVFLILLAVAIKNTKINKILNILIQVFKIFKINNIRKITKNKIY